MYQHISLDKIKLSATNPRHHINESELLELAESIKVKQVLQAVLVRPLPEEGFYELVCGERRYRASILAEMPTIPATIREMTDAEALEAQIVENMQRADVHPMAEAKAFAILIGQGLSIQEVSVRVGKKEWYIRQRMKLNELAKPWQALFFNNCITISEAIRVAQLAAQQQNLLFKEVSQHAADKGNFKVSLSNWHFNRYTANLKDAVFDLTDLTLNRKMGACTNCPYNTAASGLFPDESATAFCNYSSCFQHKSNIHFDRELKNAKDDPAMYFVTDGNADAEFIKELKKGGFAILKQYDEYSKVQQPEAPDLKEITEQANNKKEAKKEFDIQQERYESRLIAYNKLVATGKVKKAFIVDGNNKGKYISIKLENRNNNGKADEGGKLITGFDQEIERIQTREKRAKELDAEKIWMKVKALPKESFLSATGELSKTEQAALLIALYEKTGYGSRAELMKITGAADGMNLSRNAEQITPEMFNQCLRYFILDTLAVTYGSHLTGGPQNALKNVFTAYCPQDVEAIETQQAEIAKKRSVRVKERVNEIKQSKKGSLKKAA